MSNMFSLIVGFLLMAFMACNSIKPVDTLNGYYPSEEVCTSNTGKPCDNAFITVYKVK